MALSIGQTVGVSRLVAELRHQVVLSGVARRHLRYHVVPLTIEQAVVALAQPLYSTVGFLRYLGIDDVARLVVTLCVEELVVHLVGRVDGIAQHLEEGYLLFRRQLTLNSAVSHADIQIVRQALLCATRLKREVGVVQTVVLLRVPLILVAHEFRLTVPRQAVVVVEDELKL